MGLNRALSLLLYFAEVRHFRCILLNSLYPKTMDIIVSLKQCLCSIDLENFKLCT